MRYLLAAAIAILTLAICLPAVPPSPHPLPAHHSTTDELVYPAVGSALP